VRRASRDTKLASASTGACKSLFHVTAATPQDNQALFRSLFENAAAAMAVAGADGGLAHCNNSFCALLGYAKDELAGRSLAGIVEHAPHALERLNAGDGASGLWRFRRKDGSILVAEAVTRKFAYDGGEAIALDIKEQGRAGSSEQEDRHRFFLELESRLRNAKSPRETIYTACEAIGARLDASFAGIGEFEQGGQQTLVETAWSRCGDIARLLGRHWHSETSAKRLAQRLAGGVSVLEDTLTNPLVADDAEIQTVYKAIGARSLIAVPLVRDGKTSAIIVVADDKPRAWTEAEVALAKETLDRVWHSIERARAEDRLRLSTERFEVALKGSPITVMNQDLNLRHTWVYNACIPPSLLIGKIESEVFERPEDAAASMAIKRAAMVTGKSQRAELTVHAAGLDHVYDLIAEPLRDSAGAIVGVTCALIDITERKQADAELREAKERQSFLLALSDAFRALDDPGDIAAKASELLGRKLGAGRAAFATIGEENGRIPVAREWSDGDVRKDASVHALDYARLFRDELCQGQTVVIGNVCSDARTAAPHGLAAFEQVSAGALLVIPISKAGRLAAVLGVHAGAPRAWKKEEIALTQEVAERVWDAVERARIEQALRVSEAQLRFAFEGARAGAWEAVPGSGVYRATEEAAVLFGLPSGSIMTREAILAAIHPDDRPRVQEAIRRAIETIDTNTSHTSEFRVLAKDGAVRWLESRAEMRFVSGKRCVCGLVFDITDRKRAEEALASARRLEAVGQLAGGVAHDFNNLLHVISGNIEIAQDLVGHEFARELLQRARNAAERGSAMNRRLLSLARKRALKPQSLALNERVEETSKLLSRTVGEHISVTPDLADGLWTTLADPGEIDSAILNLAANARDAMPQGGTIRISTSNVALDSQEAAKLHPCGKPGDYVCLSIADNGVGMQADVLNQAMEPFFTTKGPGAGTGLGLTSVASFAKQSGGFAVIRSEPGQGCAVSLYLPRCADASPSGDEPAELPLGNRELVLVVEDNDQVRDVTLNWLASLNYEVAEARSAPEAIEILRSQAPVRLVLSDIVMPGGMSGFDLARWAASHKPDIPVVLCSAYNEGDGAAGLEEPPGAFPMLAKPFRKEQLAQTLSESLRERV
jgi:PAS domain S-box-containing protein